MKTATMRVRSWMRAIALAAALIGGEWWGGAGALSAAPAMAQAASVADVKSLLTPVLPAGALEITAAMKSAKAGQTLTLRGNIALSKDAFGADAATFTLVDEAARTGPRPSSDALPETSDAVPAAARATVQIVDASGTPLPGTLSGHHGLKPGAEVFVTGKVHAANGTDVLVLTATSMHIPRSPLPHGFFAHEQPPNAKDVSDARKAGEIKAGDDVVLRGRIGGSKEPFVPGRAVFTLVGRGLRACNENLGDNCSKPWDYCCETKQDILANSVTVQVVDAKGQILRTDMKGRRGLKELSEIVVVGKVSSADGKAVIVNATAIFAGS